VLLLLPTRLLLGDGDVADSAGPIADWIERGLEQPTAVVLFLSADDAASFRRLEVGRSLMSRLGSPASPVLLVQGSSLHPERK